MTGTEIDFDHPPISTIRQSDGAEFNVFRTVKTVGESTSGPNLVNGFAAMNLDDELEVIDVASLQDGTKGFRASDFPEMIFLISEQDT